MAVPDFLAFARAQPVNPFQNAIQGGLQTFGTVQGLRLQREQAAQRAAASQRAQQAFQQQQIQQQAMAPTQLALLKAKVAQAQAQSAQPGGGQTLSGAAGRSMGLALLANKYGESSPIYQRAVKDYNADVQLKLGRAQYFQANVALKNMPTVNKLQSMENYQGEQSQRVAHGMPKQSFNDWYKSEYVAPDLKSGVIPHPAIAVGSPVAGAPIPPGSSQAQQVGAPFAGSAAPGQPQIPAQTLHGFIPPTQPFAATQPQFTQTPFGIEAKQTGLKIAQQTVPTFVRQKLAYASNIEKTLGQMPDAAITSYSQNPAKLMGDYQKSLSGTVTPEYANYLKYVTNAKMLATQIRQFYGDSITPSGMKKLEDLSNPISWRTSPKAALAKFNALRNTLGREIQTYRNQATQPSSIQPYGPGGATLPLKEASASAQPSLADLQYTAQKHNMSVAQVKQKLGIQ